MASNPTSRRDEELASMAARRDADQGRRPLVLVVEDDADARELLRDCLADPFRVLAAGDAEEGLEIATKLRPDVILLDLYLPGMDGFQLLQSLQERPDTAAIPVLFISARADERSRIYGLELGAADFVAKPYSAGELVARVRKALRAASYGAHLRAMAETDALTGLPNFRALSARLEEELKRATRYGHPLSVIMIDLDKLKEINDEHGHAVGNAAIVALARAIMGQLRETDFAARYGGDEFVLLLPHTNAEQACELAERLRLSLHQERFDGQSRLRASFGVSSVAEGASLESSPELLLHQADAALLRAKRSGRDKVHMEAELGGRGEERQLDAKAGT